MVYKGSTLNLLLIRHSSFKAYMLLYQVKTLEEAMGKQYFTKGWFNLR